MRKRSALLVLLVLGCGGGGDDGGGGPSGKATIGPNGGSVTSKDGHLTVTIPAGALSADTPISIELVPQDKWAPEVQAAAPISEVYDVQPDGTQFAVPAEMHWKLDGVPAAVAPDATGTPFVIAAAHSADGAVEPHDTSDATFGENLEVKSTVGHLSEQFLAPNALAEVGSVLAELGGGNHFVKIPWSGQVTFVGGGAEIKIGFSWSNDSSPAIEALHPQTPWTSWISDVALTGGQELVSPVKPEWRCKAVGAGSVVVVAFAYYEYDLLDLNLQNHLAGVTIREPVNCKELTQANGTAIYVVFPKTQGSIVPGKSVFDELGEWSVPMSESVTTIDPAAASGPQQQVVYDDPADPIRVAMSLSNPDGTQVRVGTQTLGRAFVEKLNADGTSAWATLFGEKTVDSSRAVASLGNDELAVAFGNPYGNGKLQIALVGPSGGITEIVTLAGPLQAVATDILPLSGGGYLLAGPSEPNANATDVVIAAMSNSSTLSWSKIVSNGGRVYLSSILSLSSGGFLALGRKRGPAETEFKGFALRLDQSGALVWDAEYGPNIELRQAAETASGFWVAANIGNDMGILDLGSDGSVKSARTYNISGTTTTESTLGIAATAAGGAELLGYRQTDHALHFYSVGPDLSVAGCGDPSIGAVLDTTTIVSGSGNLNVADGALTPTSAPPAFPTETKTLKRTITTADAFATCQ